MRFAFIAALYLFLVGTNATAAPTGNIPISQIPVTTDVLDNAYVPLIQPRPGQVTNDNFRASVLNMFKGRSSIVTTNITVNNVTITNGTTVIENETTIVTNSVVVYDNDTIIITNTIININGNTNPIVQVSDLLWTNIAGVLQPTVGSSVNVTNVLANETLSALGSFGIRINLTTNMVAGVNALNTHNVSSVYAQGATANPADSSMTFNSGDGSGTFLFVQNAVTGFGFTIVNGSALSDASGIISLRGSDWTPTQQGETLFLQYAQNGNLQEIGRFGGGVVADAFWFANNTTSISPYIAGTLMTIDTLGRIGIGSTNIFADKDIGIFHRADTDGNRKAFINIGMADTYPQLGGNYGGEWWANSGTNDSVMHLFTGDLPVSGGSFARDHEWVTARGAGLSYYQTTSNAVTTFKVDVDSGYIYTKGNIYFGTGFDHVLSRNGDDLLYSADAVSPVMRLFNTTSNMVVMGFGSSGTIAELLGDQGVAFGWSTYQLDMGGSVGSGNITPNVPINFGTVGHPFDNVVLQGTNVIYGYNDLAAINYSRLAVYHTGTNGAIVFDSQAAGDAGRPRPISFTNAVTYANVNGPGVAGYFSQFNFVHTNAYSGLMGTGDTDVYTVPSGKRFLIQAIVSNTTNTSGTTVFPQVKTNSVYYRLASNSSVTTNSSLSISGDIVLEQGESISFNTSNTGANAFVYGLLYDNTVPIYSPRLMAMTTGLDVVYTVPANTFSAGYLFGESISRGASVGQAIYLNSSGSTRQISAYFVPSGGSPDSGNLIIQGPKSNLVRSTINFGPMLPGDSFVIQSDATTATQWAFLTVVEVPYSQ